MTFEEKQVFEMVAKLKQERDMLYVLVEEMDEMIELGYSCSNCLDERGGLFYAYEQYKRWKKDKCKKHSRNNCVSYLEGAITCEDCED